MRVLNTSAVPPGGVFRYIDPETGQRFEHPYFQQVRTMATAHRTANNLPIAVNWEQAFESNVCDSTPTCECEPDEPADRITFRQIANATRAAAEWARNGFRVTSQAMLEQRYDICRGNDAKNITRCSWWGGDGAGFGLGRCGRCGCSGLKLYSPTERCPAGKWPENGSI